MRGISVSEPAAPTPEPMPQDALASAQAEVARQAEEIARLRRRLADERFAEDLRDALNLVAAAGRIASPVTHSRLLEMIVETAADVISAQAASLLLVDEAAHELIFEVALGQKADSVKKLRVPLGHGIAGLVAATGQPMAIASAQSDARQAHDIAQRVGYAPQTLLCVPLFYHDRVIGVLELMDKAGGEPFSTSDMGTLGLFANQAAVAIEQSRTHQNLAALLGALLASLPGLPEGNRADLAGEAGAFAAHMEDTEAYRRTRDLAGLVHEIACRGGAATDACRTMLRGFVQFLQATDRPGGQP